MTNPHYLKTNDMAKHIGYSGDFLLKNRGILFYENIHYFPKGFRINWKVIEMVAWVENKHMSRQAKTVLVPLPQTNPKVYSTKGLAR